MSTSIPRITVRPYDDGWTATCGCAWRMWHRERPVVDLAASKHQGACGRRKGA
ncbi:hypothetical protein [Nocardioides sp.]|uniref:hypothetical protein n=1 Tax=Nocardioides sp. TaxID=35761 RepID=UPI0035117F0B